MKSFFYFLVIIMLCVASIGLPLDYSAFVYEPGIPWESNAADDVTFTLSLLNERGEKKLLNPSTVKVIITSDQETEVEFDENPPLIVEVHQNGQKVSTLNIEVKNNFDSQGKVTVSKQSPLEYTIDLSKVNTGLDEGEYTFVITSSNSIISKNSKSPLNIDVSYNQIELNYTPAAKSIPSGQKFITAYYIDGAYNTMLVPVTTAVSESQQTLIAMMYQLKQVPKEGIGLAAKAPFAPLNTIGRYDLTKSTGYISFPSSTLNPSEDPGLNHLAIQSFIKTLSGYSHLRALQLAVDNQIVDSFLNGVSIKEPFPMDRQPSVFLALENIKDKRILLVDHDDTSLMGISSQQAANNIIDILKSGVAMDEFRLSPTIPANVQVKDVSIEGRVLNIDFSNDILEAFKDDEARQSMMMDSIILSLKSIPDIGSVKISVEGNSDLTLGGWNLSKPISDNLGVNPLK